VGEGGEAHFAGDFFAELDQGVGGEGDDFSGIEVEEMVVAFASPAAAGAGAFGGVDEIVVGLLAHAEVDLFEETGVKEMLEGAVDGGLGGADGGFAEFQEKFFGFEGAFELLDGFEDGEALGGELEFSLAEEVAKDVLGVLWLHDGNDGARGGWSQSGMNAECGMRNAEMGCNEAMRGYLTSMPSGTGSWREKRPVTTQ
jgi:hypothetical protein